MKKLYTLCIIFLMLSNSLKLAAQNYGVHLTQNNDYVVFNNPNYNFTNQLTIEFWVYYDNVSNFLWAGQSGLDNLTFGNNTWHFFNDAFYINDNGQWKLTTYTNPTTTGWHHIAAVAEPNRLSVYVDGVLAGENLSVGNITLVNSNNPEVVTTLGRDPRSHLNNGTHGFDDFRVWNIARTQAQIQDNFTTCFNANTANLVQYTVFSEGTGTNVNSVIGLNGTIVNNANAWVTGEGCAFQCNMDTITASANQTAVCEGSATTITVSNSETGIDYYLRNVSNDSIIDGPTVGTGNDLALNTDSINDPKSYYVYAEQERTTQTTSGAVGLSGFPHRVNLGGDIWNNEFAGRNQMTVEAWVFRTGTDNFNTIIGNYEGQHIFLFRIRLDTIYFGVNNGAFVKGNSSIPIGSWTHLAGVYDGSSLSIYVNGVFENSVPYSSNLGVSNHHLKIGGSWPSNNNEYFLGNISELRLWNVARTPAELNALISKQLTGNEFGLVGYYQFNEGSGTTTANSAKNGLYNGTFESSPTWQTGLTITESNCFTESAQTFTVNVDTLPTLSNPTDTIRVCDSYELPPLITGNYFTASNGGGTALNAGDFITSTQTVYVYLQNGACNAENSFEVIITPTPTVDVLTNIVSCDGLNLPNLSVGNYFSDTNGGGTAYSVGQSITNSQTVYIYAANGTCTDESSFDISITTMNAINASANQTEVCEGSATAITISNSEVGVDYYLRNVSNDSIIDGPTVGTGNDLALNTENIDSPKSYYVYAEQERTTQTTSKAVGIQNWTQRVNLGTQMWNNEFAGRNQVTVEAWIYRTATGNLNTVLGNYQGSYRLLFRIWHDNKIQFILNDFAVGVTSVSNIPANTWTHVAGVYNGTTASIYINGVLDSSQPYSGNLWTSSEILKIGGGLTNGTEFFQGNISEVRMWNIARTPAEITSSYTKQLTGNEFGLVGYYQFNEGSGTTTANSAKNGLYNGTLQGSPTWQTGLTITESNCFTESAQTFTISTFSAPSALAANNISGTSADLSWTSVGTNFEIEYGITSFAIGNGTRVVTSNNPYQLSGLAGLTTYDYYVRQICGPGDTTAWSSSYSFTTLLTTPQWTGNQDNNWNNPNNWTSGVPTAGQDVVIENGATNFPELEINASLNNIEVKSSASLVIKTNQTLTITGVLTNNGTVTVESGGALVQEVGSTLAGNGDYVVQRNVTAGQRFVGSPINNHSVNGTGIIPSGVSGGQIIPQADCNATAIDPSSPFGNIMEIQEDATPIHNCAQSLWFVKSTGNFTNARGYAINTASNLNMEYTGTINNGNISYSGLGRQAGSVNQSNGFQTRGWHLVSNPYPSPIRITNGDLGADWDNSVHFYDGTDFVSVQLTLADAVVPVGQAFQIRKSVEGGSATFSITNSIREGGNPSFYSVAQLTQEHINITLSNNQYQSKTTVYFENGATSDFDPQYDAVKLFGAHYLPQLYTVEASHLAERLSYNALTPLSLMPTQSVVMGAYTPNAGSYQLTFDGVNTISGSVILEDKKLNIFTNITENYTYNIVVAEGDEQDRFILHFNENTTSANSTLDFSKVKMFPNPSSEFTTLFFQENHDFNSINVIDFAGKKVKTFIIDNQNDTYQLDVRSLRQGIYFVQLIGENNNEIHKLVVR